MQPRATARKYATGSGSFFLIVGKVKLSYSWINHIFDRQLKEQSEDSSIGWKWSISLKACSIFKETKEHWRSNGIKWNTNTLKFEVIQRKIILLTRFTASRCYEFFRSRLVSCRFFSWLFADVFLASAISSVVSSSFFCPLWNSERI